MTSSEVNRPIVVTSLGDCCVIPIRRCSGQLWREERYSSIEEVVVTSASLNQKYCNVAACGNPIRNNRTLKTLSVIPSPAFEAC
jgi:hypothetical protein